MKEAVVVRSEGLPWRALPIPGVSVRALRRDAESGESTTIVRFDAGVRFPAHDHPGGEEILVLEGDLRVGPDLLHPGDYLYTPPNGKHAASSEGGCTFLVTLPQPVRFL
jgi:quercetin dioxygenase-like cupin family protein